MTIVQMEVERFRCVHEAKLEFDPRKNLIVGPNASGKTSLLEAIFVLGAGRSFRTQQSELLIERGADDFLALARVAFGNQISTLGVRGSRQGKELRINGEFGHGLAELARNLPVQVIDPNVHRLLEDGPVRRRHYLDWGVFHVEPRFNEAWRRYQRALRHRNVALRNKLSRGEVAIWESELIEQGTAVARFRDEYITQLRPFAEAVGHSLLGLTVELEHQRGWKKGVDLADALTESAPIDALRGATSVGAHRADINLKVAGLSTKDRISRGQQKMLACALILSQQTHRAAVGAPPACLLLDDPAAELDVDNLQKLLTVMAATPAQLVVTSLTDHLLKFFPDARLFHVEHGRVTSGIMG